MSLSQTCIRGGYYVSAYLNQADVRSNGIDDPEEVRLFCHIDANAQIRALALDRL